MTFYCSTPGCPQHWQNFRGPRGRKSAKCAACGQPATRLKRVPAGVGAYVLKDFPEHFNWSFGCVVKNREHHRELQRKHHVQDWEPVKESPGLSKLRKEGYL